MAEFLPILNHSFKVEGGYTNDPNDVGNWYKGQLIGTNHGVAAITLASFLGRTPTVDEMKSLTKTSAENIYKKLFWIPMKGDKIMSQSVALIFWESFVASGNLIRARKAINEYYKKKVVSESNLHFDDNVINYTNNANAKKLFDIAKANEIAQRYARVEANPSQAKYLKGWINRLEGVTFTDNIVRNTALAGFGFLLISISFFLIYKSNLIRA
jgi:lysozyme family protein